MFCPKCKAEYHACCTQCSDSHVDPAGGLSIGPLRSPEDRGQWGPTLARFGTVILLGWSYPKVSHLLAIPNVFGALVGYLIGASVWSWYPPRKNCPPGKVPATLVLLGTLVAVNMPHLFLYLESGGGDAPENFLSFLAYTVANERLEVWSEETDSLHVYEGFEAFLLHVLILWMMALVGAMCSNVIRLPPRRPSLPRPAAADES